MKVTFLLRAGWWGEGKHPSASAPWEIGQGVPKDSNGSWSLRCREFELTSSKRLPSLFHPLFVLDV